MKNKGEIILYHPENIFEIEVRMEDGSRIYGLYAVSTVVVFA